ncbi:MAG: ParB/RepB/Spo0J family partition protein [Helicobacteraceae bacterium]|jgi:ParB family chromosome partitioning protein|nr:ParB/RepB/Spo0J family partition protein [Helicobacteraceae bacterium]
MSERLKITPRLENITTNRTLKGTSGEIRRLLIDELTPNPYQPRWDFEVEALQELSDSIKEHGQIQPVVVCDRDDGKDGYYIIAGERRWRACKLAGMSTVSCVIQPPMDKKGMQIVALQENIQRENLHPIEVAIGIQRMVETNVLNDRGELDAILGFGDRTMCRYLDIAKLSEPACEVALKSNYRDTVVLGVIAKQVTPTNQERVLQKIINDGMTQKEALAHVRQLKAPKTIEPFSFRLTSKGVATFTWKPSVTFEDASKKLERYQQELRDFLETLDSKYAAESKAIA